MGNFEKLSVLVIVVIIVMILVVALYTWTDKPSDAIQADAGTNGLSGVADDLDDADGSVVTVWDRDDEVRGRSSGLDDGDTGDGDTGDDDSAGDDTGDRGTGDRGTGDREASDDDAGCEEDTADDVASDDSTVNEEWVYEVKKGDTIGHIAMRELTTIRRQGEIYDLNPGLDPMRLQIGQKLRMPARGTAIRSRAGSTSGAAVSTGGAAPVPGGEYVTRHGDQLRTIAKRAYDDWERWPEIFAKNFGVIDDPERVPPGVKIFIPK